MRRVCTISGEEFEISNQDLSFYERMGVPPPTLCPEERQRRRMTYRNFNSLYHRTCSKSAKRILSMYDQDAPFPVYDLDLWWSDQWDPLDYGQEFDFSRTFFEQYRELSNRVPRFGIMNTQCENCQFSNFAFAARNCYLIFGCVNNDSCLYGHIVWNSEHCVDNLYAYECQWCSNSVDLVGCYDVHYCAEAVNCQESYFLHDCRNCRNCFGCTNLRNKQYYFLNQPLTQKQYQEKIRKIFPLSVKAVQEMTVWLEEKKRSDCVFPPMFATQAEEVTGNHIYHSHNLEHCFDAKRSENAKNCFTVFDVDHSYDLSFGSGRFSLESVALINTEQAVFCHTVADSHDLAYSEYCFSCHDLFACAGLRRAEYCILNKAYPREEYFTLRSRIVEHIKETGEWGEFFPSSDSPFAYNESIAGQYLPLEKKEVLGRGLRWRNDPQEIPNSNTPGTLPPERIDQVGDDLAK